MKLRSLAPLLLALSIVAEGKDDLRQVDLGALRDAARCEAEVMRVLKDS